MEKRRNILSLTLNTAVFILLEIAALHILGNNGTIQNFFLMKGVHGLMGKVWGSTEAVSRYFSLKKENEALSMEVFRLSRQVDNLNRRLEDATLEASAAESDIFTREGPFEFKRAAVVKQSLNKQHNYLIISKGSEDGIRPQSGLVSSSGVIGIVDAVGKHYSYAISFLNSEMSISARIGMDGASGPMTWDGVHRDGAILKEIPLQNKFEKGDTVYTSGYSSIFPADIPLGVTGKSKIVNGSTYEVNIRLFQDYSAVRHVTVVWNRDRQEMENLEASDTKVKDKLAK